VEKRVRTSETALETGFLWLTTITAPSTASVEKI